MNVVLTNQQRKLILFEETEENFGYKVQDLSFGSTKKVLHRCIVCGKPKKSSFREFLKGEKLTHYKECREIKTKQTNLRKYGVISTALVPEVKAAQKRTLYIKHGVEHPIQVPKVQQKMRQTMRERYGVDYYTQTSEMQKKTRQTCLKKYGVEHSAQSSVKKDKTKQTCLEKYGVEHTGKIVTHQQVKDFIEQQKYTLLSKQYKSCHIKLDIECDKGHQYQASWANFQQGHRCPKCSHCQSKGELEIVNYLRSKGVYVIERDRKILGGKELDIFIPSREWVEKKEMEE